MPAILYLSIPVLPSLLAAILIVLLVRKRVRGNQRARISLTLGMMLLGFLISFGITVFLFVGLLTAVADYYDTSIQMTDETRPQVNRELTLREIVPSALRPACMTSESICAVADAVVSFNSQASDAGDSLTQNDYAYPLPITVMAGLSAAVLNGALVWFSLRTKNTLEPITPPAAAG